MAVSISDIVVGGHYLAGDEQERRVTEITDGKVHYDSRSYRLKNEWSYGHTLKTPPSIDKFCNDCYKVLSKPE